MHIALIDSSESVRKERFFVPETPAIRHYVHAGKVERKFSRTKIPYELF